MARDRAGSARSTDLVSSRANADVADRPFNGPVWLRWNNPGLGSLLHHPRSGGPRWRAPTTTADSRSLSKLASSTRDPKTASCLRLLAAEHVALADEAASMIDHVPMVVAARQVY
jgi:hypothetical protein